ncbi:hypothetical protein SAMN02745824_1326 [Parasphingorhabdus marina DSM 22363]|uniref:site-specific DNA-methyltransferase (adenine-specific) n=2 Tax=Parasphingorhabdus marina TaxID=394732 RepID=A0A1N6CZJ7_9SPHN|nr:hypothetical protein SAMN02745824_1326 [Parasphingorhabdus marina DSM 22363]
MALAKFPTGTNENEDVTEDDLIVPILEILGWEHRLTEQNLSAKGRQDVPDWLLFIDEEQKQQASEHPEYKRYEYGAALLEAKRWNRPLDRAASRTESDTPSAQILRYLRRVDDLTNGALRWGILTNGNKWRLYWSGARSTIDDYCEIDLGRIFKLDDDLFDSRIDDDKRAHWLKVFALLFRRQAFERDTTSNLSFHDRARKESLFYEERVAKDLSGKVFNTIFPAFANAINDAAPEDTSLDDIRQASMILLYRLLFILYAEDRNLLPVRDSRFDDYALRPKREEVGQRITDKDAFSETANQLWNRYADLARIIDKGDPSVGIPPYNGGLFSEDETPLLEQVRIPDSVMGPALDALSYERSMDEPARYINYRDLSVQQLGSIYERLLEFEPVPDPDNEGALIVRPNPFARKSSGSYYTPDELVLLIIDETLEPLIEERKAAFEEALAALDPKDNADYRSRQLRKVDPAQAIGRLRVCDPAMGSGHFLVSLVDRLADHVIEAQQWAAEQANEADPDLDYQSPLGDEIERIRETIHDNASDGGWAISEDQLDDPQLVKRMILKRCVHGVDKNDMAVELAKVSLWLHTFTVGAPLSFIDHHLQCGDSLFGLWVRDAIDRANKLGGELLHSGPLRKAQAQAEAMKQIEKLTDADIGEAHESRVKYDGVVEMTAELDAFVSFMHALDWLDLKESEQKEAVRALVDGQFGDPVLIMQGRTEPMAKTSAFKESGASDRMKGQTFEASELLEPITKILQDARQLIAEERFFNWQIRFPGVWKNWASAGREGGFDAVIGNPPWDKIKLQQVEWFEERRKDIALAKRASERKALIRKLEDDEEPLFADYKIAEKRAKDMAKQARKSGHYPLLSKGDMNIYALFVERTHAILKPNGMSGLLLPIGIGTDKYPSEFFSKMVQEKKLKCFISFENKGRWLFKDVHSEDQPTVFVTSSQAKSYDQVKYAVKLHELSDHILQTLPACDAAELTSLNPNTQTAPVIRKYSDLPLLLKIYRRAPVLVDRSGDEPSLAWPMKYVTMFHMTNDSEIFLIETELNNHWSIGTNKFESDSEIRVPLYEGKSIQIDNHRYAGVEFPEGRTSGQGNAIKSSIEELSDPSFTTKPRYWVKEEDIPIRRPYHFAFNGICNSNNTRTLISAIIPDVGCGNSLPVFEFETDDAHSKALLQGNFGCVLLDYVLRQKLHSRNLNKFVVEQLPVIPPSAYSREFGDKTAAEIVREAVLELTYTAHDMAPFARDMGYVDDAGEVKPPFIWDSERRLQLRARLDALYFILYGVFDPNDAEQSRDDIRYIYSTFPIVEKDEIKKYGNYRSRDLALAWINALMAGKPNAEIFG